MGVTMEFLRRFVSRNQQSAGGFSVVRMSRGGHHYYSILANENGFEFVFRNGHDRWSTISPSAAKRLIQHYQSNKEGKALPTSTKQWIKLATLGETGGWHASKAINYRSSQEALLIERAILDASWEGKKGISHDK
jgi:hypothetical protein